MLRIAGICLVLMLSTLPAWAVELVMVEQRGCYECARWKSEIGPIYPKSAEGRYAPLRQIDKNAEAIADLALKRRVIFTPTFVLVDQNGTEMARLEGYPGEDFFWGLLERILVTHTDYEPPAGQRINQ